MDISDALAALGIEVERSEIRLHDGPLRVVGEHQVEIHLHADVNVPVKVVLEGPAVTEDPGVSLDDRSEEDDD
jgi:large subunit ribosomal protein L9